MGALSHARGIGAVILNVNVQLRLVVDNQLIQRGAAANLGPVIDFSDAAIFAMAVVNIFCLYFLMKLVRQELNSYSARLKSGEIRKFTH